MLATVSSDRLKKYIYVFTMYQVIDDEKHLKELELKKKAKKKGDTSTSALDVPAPPNNIKRSKIKTYKIKHDELDEDRNLIERGKNHSKL